MQGERVLRRARGVGERAEELCTAARDDGASVPMGGVRSSEGVRPLEGEARALEMVGRRARARGAGRSGVRSAWYHLQAERAVGRCAQQCEGRRAPAGGGEPSSALGIASEKTRAGRGAAWGARGGRSGSGCAQAGGSSPSGAPRRPREAIIHSQHTNTSIIHNTPIRKRAHQAQDIHTSHTSCVVHIVPTRKRTHQVTSTARSR